MMDNVHHAHFDLPHQRRRLLLRHAFLRRIRLRLLLISVWRIALLLLIPILLLIAVLRLSIALLPAVLRRIALLLRVRLHVPLLPFVLRWIALSLFIAVRQRIVLLLRIRLLLIRLLRLSRLRRCFYRLSAVLAKARTFRQLVGTICTKHSSYRQANNLDASSNLLVGCPEAFRDNLLRVFL